MTTSPVIEAADLGLTGHPADPAIFPANAVLSTEPAAQLPPFSVAKRAVVDAFERNYLENVLRAHCGNVSRAAQSARKERRDFGRLLKKHQLDPRSF